MAEIKGALTILVVISFGILIFFATVGIGLGLAVRLFNIIGGHI